MSEVLITLGIIGMIAALTIPGLMKKYNELYTVNHLKETYSILNQAFKMASEEYGDPSTWDANLDAAGATKVMNNIKPFIKVAVDCGTKDSKGQCIPKDYYSTVDGTTDTNFTQEKYYKVKLMNGTVIMVRGVWNMDTASINGHNRVMVIGVDTNGAQKPNIYGRDFFAFGYYEGLGVFPSGYELENPDDDCLEKKSTSCTNYILKYEKMDYLK